MSTNKLVYSFLMLLILAASPIFTGCSEDTTMEIFELPFEISSNQIVYKTSDNACIHFEDEDAFGGAKILSTTFSKEEKYWTIEFDSAVTAIEREAFTNSSNLTGIIIPNSVQKIGRWAFGNCPNLARFTIPESVKSIGQFAFAHCTKLTEIEIPYSVTHIDLSPFDGCNNLTSMRVDEKNSVYDSREECNAIIYTRTNDLIVGCKATVIPNSVTGISTAAFFGNEGLTSIQIPSSVRYIGQYAFSACTNLTKVSLPESITEIDTEAFSDCPNLIHVVLPSSMTEIGERAFKNCTSLTGIVIPSSVTEIISNPFIGCSNLMSIKVDKGNSVYDSRNNCNAIIYTMENELVAGCQTTIIPSSVTTIRYYAFKNCSTLTSITIPYSITRIGDEVFKGCSNLAEVYCQPLTPPRIKNRTFEQDSTQVIYVPASALERYKAIPIWERQNLQPIR